MNSFHDWNLPDGEAEPQATMPRVVDHTLSCARLTPSLHLPELEGQRSVLAALGRLGLTHLCLGSWCEGQVRALAPICVELELQGWVEAPPGPTPPASLRCYFSHRQKSWPERMQQAHAPSVLVVQDATRRTPAELVELLGKAPARATAGVCLSDDGGRATPAGAAALVRFVARAAQRLGLEIEIEWSGRNDRGLALASSLAAWQAGASALHCAFFGLGEGCGLTPTELLLANLTLAGALCRDLSAMAGVSAELAALLGLELPGNLPLVGRDAFRTGTGVHAAALLKARAKGDEHLVDMVYSGVPASAFGFAQVIEIGPMAGASNVHHWLQAQGLQEHPELVALLLAEAKQSSRVLTEEQLWQHVHAFQARS